MSTSRPEQERPLSVRSVTDFADLDEIVLDAGQDGRCHVVVVVNRDRVTHWTEERKIFLHLF